MTAFSTTMVYRSISELVEMSDVVVRGTLTRSASHWGANGLEITSALTLFTDWTLSVDETLKGAVESTLIIRQWGGEVEGQSLRIPGDARLSEGEHVVLFLREVEGIFYLTAMGQAKLAVSLQGREQTGEGLFSPEVSPIDATLIRDISDMAFYEVVEGRPQIFRVETAEIISLEDLRRLVLSQRDEAGER
jgi:hypothetical protein